MGNVSQKPGVGEKICYFMANVGNIPLMGLLSTFFLIFYTDVVGLDPAALATLFLISKVMDGVSDPIMGFILDKFPVTKMGKFRPMLMLGTVICVINYILLWFGAVWSPVGKYVIVYVTYLLLGWTFDMMDISLNSLLPVMTAENKERNKLSMIKSLGYVIGGAVIGILGPIIVKPKTLESYYILIFGSMAVTLVYGVVVVAATIGIEFRVRRAQERLTADSGRDFYVDEDGSFMADNDERAIFFARGILETVKKLRWKPDIVHCSGWISHLIPLYLKKAYKNDPIFSEAKVVVSLYNEFPDCSLASDMKSKVPMTGIKSKDIELLKTPTGTNLAKLAIQYADAVILGAEDVSEEITGYAVSRKLPVLDYTPIDHPEGTYIQKYNEFYDKLLD